MSGTIDLEALCHEKGLRITEQRRIIARVISDSEDHPDVETLYERASKVDSGRLSTGLVMLRVNPCGFRSTAKLGYGSIVVNSTG